MKCLPLSVILFTLSPAFAENLPAGEGDRRAFTPEVFLSIERISDPRVSPRGDRVAFVKSTPSLEENRVTSHIWLVPAAGGEPRQLTTHEKGESRPRWSPDGKKIAFLSSRGGSSQIWVIPVDGGEATQVSRISTGASDHVWSPTGTHLAFTSKVWPGLEGGDDGQEKKAREMKDSGIQARIIDRLPYRHWSEWLEGKRNHIFVVSAEGGEARDITPGDANAPSLSLWGPDAFAFSPDGKEIAYTRGLPGEEETWSTNADLLVVSLSGGEPANLTAKNRGWDGSPVWSPDGRFIAFRSQEREGYESDRFRLALLERESGAITYPLEGLDRSVDQILWSPGGKTIYVEVEDEARTAVHALPAPGVKGKPEKIISGVTFSGLTLPGDGSFLVGVIQSLTRPQEVARVDLGQARKGRANPRLLTRIHDSLVDQLDMPSYSSIWYPGALGARIQAWFLKPPGFQPGRRYPFILFIHGGPQGAWMDLFHYRWNPALFAARGFTVLAVNPHGSSGFGQAFKEQISGDWGGAVFEDLMKGVDWAIRQGHADPDRLGAMGGSFGGYMVNWICGHTGRFRALVSHAGVYNLESMYGSTEELWFPEWDLGGTPWRNRGDFEKFSPHRFAANFKTPTLVIHGQLDFRVPVTEGMQLFTALRRQGVEARFLYYPDEGHFVLKPRNAKLWNETVIAWFERFLKR